MGENKTATLAKAIVELEEMYSGIPDESVDLTFQHLANLKHNPNYNPQDHHNRHQQNNLTNNNNVETNPHENMANSSTLVHEEQTNITPLRKIPSLDFSRGLEAANNHHQHQHHHHHHHGPLGPINEDGVVNHPFRANNHHYSHDHHGSNYRSSPYSCVAHSGFRHAVESANAVAGRDVDAMSGRSLASAAVGRRRPGIPHSQICAVCTTYTYFFRHLCLVCGRVYCRHCVNIGMGEMTEGRKCIECLGRRFSQRYIQRAGEVGCFCSRYPGVVRQAELKWAEKGPRKNGEKAYGRSVLMSRSRSPIGPITPTGTHASNEPHSFVMSSTYSPYTPTHHHFPF